MKHIILFVGLFLLAYGHLSAQTAATETSPARHQCIAVTKAGAQCRNNAVAGDTKCRIHSDSTPRCGAITAAGTPCKLPVKTAGDKCWRHKPKQ